MNAAPTPADSTSPSAYPEPDIAYAIGWEHARRGCVPPAEQLQPDNPVRLGWEAGRARFGRRTLPADHHVRQWLRLRLDAWQQGLGFEPLQLNPALLRHIEPRCCPVTGAALTHGSGGPDDATVTRINAGAGWALGNLAVISARAHRAKAAHGPQAALDFARRIEDGGPAAIAGLDAAQWQRLAVLTAFATPLPHGRAATLPLLVLPPPRLQVLNPAQALQVMLSLQFTRAGHARRCTALAARLPSADARHAFHAFLHTLLARRLAAGRCADTDGERARVERLWLDPLVNRRWQRLVLQLDAAACEQLVAFAVERGLAGAALRWRPQQAATEGWALGARAPAAPEAGRAPAGEAAASIPAAVSPALRTAQARYASRPACQPQPALPAPLAAQG